MKKILALVLALVMILSLAACGAKEEPAAPAAPEAPAAAVEMTAAEKAAAEAEIRYALALLLDRNYIVEEITQAGQLPASSFVPMGLTDADGSQFYENAGPNADFNGYYNVAVEAIEENFNTAVEVLKKYYTYDEATGKFTDVPAWAADYVDACYANGIVSGVSATEFDPTANVTGVAFAKMLLTAVGYGQNGEFEGAAWDINTISLANQLGLYAGTAAADLTGGADAVVLRHPESVATIKKFITELV